ncbi:MAG: DUF4345 domain-containing protein [Pseudomonadota bacterium]
MTVNEMQRPFLILVGVALAPVAFAYGIVPEVTMPLLFDVDASEVGVRNIFRAVMGLYLALAGFWILGGVRPALRRGALWSLIMFMSGVGAGRSLSMVLDGWPHPLLVFFTGVEVLVALAGVVLLRAQQEDAI